MDADEPPLHSDELAERVAHLEGRVEAEDNTFDQGLESVKHGQLIIIGVSAVVIGAGVALVIYLLQRIDTISLMVSHH